MNKDQLEGTWEQFKGMIRENWGKLTDDDIALVKGNRQQFFGKLQENYGVAKEDAENRLKEFANTCKYCDENKVNND